MPVVAEGPGGFAARVASAVASTGPLCAGIDPSSALLDRWGLPDDPSGLREFGSRCIEAFAGTVPVVKAQVAFFERFGSAGLAALEQLLEWARDAELLVIADAKRGDIENTMTGYATAWLDPVSPLSVDAVTAVPYLGLGSLEPMVELAARHRRGVVVVVRSSNREGREVQEARTGSGTGPSVEDLLLSEIATREQRSWRPPGDRRCGHRGDARADLLLAGEPRRSRARTRRRGAGRDRSGRRDPLRRLRPGDRAPECLAIVAAGRSGRGEPRRGRPSRP